MKAATSSFLTTYGTAEVRLSVVREDALAASVPKEQPVMNRADLAARYWADYVAQREGHDEDKEHFVVVMLDRRNRVKGWNLISTGTATASLAHPREVFRAAIVGGACAILCMHNHPSGDPSPSAADIQLTRQMMEAGRTVDIPIMDHVIVGRESADPLGRGYYSFREAGLL